MVDAWPGQTTRCYKDIPVLGNLGTQAGKRTTISRPLLQHEYVVLGITTSRAETLRWRAKRYRNVVDLHGCGSHYPSLMWVSRNIDDRELQAMVDYYEAPASCPHNNVILKPDRFGFGRLLIEVSDNDIELYLEELPKILGRLAVGYEPTLDSETRAEYLSRFQYWQFEGSVYGRTDQFGLYDDGQAPWLRLPLQLCEQKELPPELYALSVMPGNIEVVSRSSFHEGGVTGR